MIMVAAVAISGCGSSGPGASSSAPSSPSPTVPLASTTTSVPPTAETSPSGISALGPDGSGAFGAGTYTTAFQPPLRFTLAEATIVGANGTIEYESIGSVDVNQPGWTSISFGFDKPSRHGHGTWSSDWFVTRIDKVFDPIHPDQVIDPPKDLAAWIRQLPGLELTAPSKATRIGGLDATQLDVISGDKEVVIGPIPGVMDPPAFGFGPHHPARIIVVNVEGHDVLIQISADDDPVHFERAVAALQPLVDSIEWL